MRTTQRRSSIVSVALTALAAFAAAFVLAVVPAQAWAAVNCPSVLAVADNGADTDSDGFTDFQECSGITLANGASGVPDVPTCTLPIPTDPVLRRNCLDPNSKDLFVILTPAPGSVLLPPTPFNNVSYYGVQFRGFDDLFVTVHQIAPEQAFDDRTVTSSSPQKAVKITESLNASGSVLGYCQWGTPNGLDGCTVYTQRIANFIDSTCGSLDVVKADGSVSNKTELGLAYATHVVLHETGHTSGGMTGLYNSSYGGYHYVAGDRKVDDSRMSQYVTYSTKRDCKFNFASGWNFNDALTIELK